MDRAVCANQITAMFNDDVDSYTTINQCETHCGETWALNSTPFNILGDEGTPTLSSPVSIPSLSIATQPVDGVDICQVRCKYHECSCIWRIWNIYISMV